MKQLSSFAIEYAEYWKSIKRYNTWFIQLRWGFSIVLFISILVCKYIFHFQLSLIQLLVFLLVNLFIVFYNIYFHMANIRSEKYSSQSLLVKSFSQILLDLLSLSVLIYFSGGIETPLFLFYIFHMIIGSLILPKKIVFSIASVLIINISVFTVLEYRDIIPHQNIVGLYHYPLYKELNFVVAILLTFSFLILMCIIITNKIASELYSREAQLRRALDEVHDAEKSKQKFVMAIVHELKSPITAASANLDLILSNILGDMNDLIREKVKRSRFRLSESIKMINGILRVSRFKLLNKVELEEIRISEIIQEVVQSSSSLAAKKQIEVIYNDNENLPIKVDKVLMELVISNLINNALKYTTNEGKVEILLYDDDGFRIIEITDNGIGIPENEIEKIFEEYYRATNAKNIEGTGTGLSVVKEIIDVHGGNITIKSPSRLGNAKKPGTEIQIRLPLK